MCSWKPTLAAVHLIGLHNNLTLSRLDILRSNRLHFQGALFCRAKHMLMVTFPVLLYLNQPLLTIFTTWQGLLCKHLAQTLLRIISWSINSSSLRGENLFALNNLLSMTTVQGHRHSWHPLDATVPTIHFSPACVSNGVITFTAALALR